MDGRRGVACDICAAMAVEVGRIEKRFSRIRRSRFARRPHSECWPTHYNRRIRWGIRSAPPPYAITTTTLTPTPAGASFRRPPAPRKGWPAETRVRAFALAPDGQLRAVAAGDPDGADCVAPRRRLGSGCCRSTIRAAPSSISICRFAARPRPGRSRWDISARASTDSSPRMPASRIGSPASRTSFTCIASVRCAMRSWSAPARLRPTIRSSRRGSSPARTRCVS